MDILESDGLLRLLDAASGNHEIIANNLANLETPGYKTGRMRFAQELEAVLDERGNIREGKKIDTETFRPLFPDAGPDGNDVSLEREIVEMNKNTLRMKLYLSILGSRIKKVQTAIESR